MLAWSVWLAAGCTVSRESLGELPEAGSGGRKRGVLVAGSGGQLADAGDSDTERDASSGSAGSDAAPDPRPGGGSAAGSGGASADVCAAQGRDAAAQPLASYCDLEHAQCPRSLGSGRARACDPVYHPQGPLGRMLYEQRGMLANTCGGTTVRLRLKYGTIEYHYGADDTLRAVTTLTPAAGGPCAATFYHYGDIGCAPSGDLKDLGCDP
ncbi:MAG TPA: hypothetical protein VJR89_01930 [Polyangiales bacterium]|nr:hypothetical protein [Polyangiales bacterium]